MWHPHPYDIQIIQHTRELVQQSIDLLAASRKTAPLPWRSPAERRTLDHAFDLQVQLQILQDRDKAA